MANSSRVELLEVFGDRLSEVRQEKGWSQRKLAEQLDAMGHPISREAVAKLEAKRQEPSLRQALALAAALGVPLNALLLPRQDLSFIRVVGEIESTSEAVRNWLSGAVPLMDRTDDMDALRFFFDQQASDIQVVASTRWFVITLRMLLADLERAVAFQHKANIQNRLETIQRQVNELVDGLLTQED